MPSESSVKILSNEGDLLFQCQDDLGRGFTVARMVDRVSISGSIGNQLISYPGPLKKKHLQDAFPDRTAVAKRCLMHTRGVLNKVAAMRRAKELVSEDLLQAEKLEYLLTFLKSCNCAPVRAIQKLAEKGYADIVEKLGLYEETPLLEETSQAFFDFIQALPEENLA